MTSLDNLLMLKNLWDIPAYFPAVSVYLVCFPINPCIARYIIPYIET